MTYYCDSSESDHKVHYYNVTQVILMIYIYLDNVYQNMNMYESYVE